MLLGYWCGRSWRDFILANETCGYFAIEMSGPLTSAQGYLSFGSCKPPQPRLLSKFSKERSCREAGLKNACLKNSISVQVSALFFRLHQPHHLAPATPSWGKSPSRSLTKNTCSEQGRRNLLQENTVEHLSNGHSGLLEQLLYEKPRHEACSHLRIASVYLAVMLFSEKGQNTIISLRCVSQSLLPNGQTVLIILSLDKTGLSTQD